MPSGGKSNTRRSHQEAWGKLAFEHPALVLCYPRLKQAIDVSSLCHIPGRDSGARGPNHPTVTMFLASFVELERRGLIELGPSASRGARRDHEGVWATKKSTQCQGTGTAAQVFNSINHGHSPVEDVVARFLKSYSRNPWSLALLIGIEEARDYGYIIRQTWPARGIKGWLSRLGFCDDIQSVWVRNGLKSRDAKQAYRILRVHMDEFRSKAHGIYNALSESILEGIHRGGEPTFRRIIKLPLLRKRLAH